MKVKVSKRKLPSYFEIAPLAYEAEDVKTIEHRAMPESKVLKLKNRKRRCMKKRDQKLKTMSTLIDRLPVPGEDFHIIGGGNIDAFHIIPCTLIYSKVINRLYISTWSMTRENMQELLKLFDEGKIKELNIVISIFFQGRYKAECHFLKTEMAKRNQRIVICKNHAKVICMDTPGAMLVSQGSANFTGNPRIEQAVFSNSHELFHHHANWMDLVLGQT